MKEPFTRFALRFPLTLGLGAVTLLLHDALSGGVLGALLPKNASAWELSKLAFFPPLLCLALTSRQSGGLRATLRRAAMPVFLAALLMAGIGTLAGSLTQDTAALMLLWIVLTALTLALAERWRRHLLHQRGHAGGLPHRKIFGASLQPWLPAGKALRRRGGYSLLRGGSSAGG